MKKLLLSVLLGVAALSAAPKKPKLVLAITVDQFRYDYLTRFRPEFKAGFDRLLTKGAVFANANYIHFPTVTAIGHSTYLSGATPSISGIVGNDWFDREEKKRVTSVSDSKTKLLGGTGEGCSPRRMLVSTIGDELKMANGNKSRVIGISLKDRSAILPAGHMADGAYWFDPKSQGFVSSTYYFKDLPGWVKDFNTSRPGDKYLGVTWLKHKLPSTAAELYGTTSESPIEKSPFGNELVLQLALRALHAEQLGTRAFTDVLAVSFSSNDKVGHDFGTFSDEEHEVTVRTDEMLERLLQAAEKQVGAENVLVVLTGDHGVAPSAAEVAAFRMPGGRIPGNTVRNAIQAALSLKYGEDDYVAGSWDLSIYLNEDTAARKGLEMAEVRRVAAEAALKVAHVARVYTRDMLQNGAAPPDRITQRVVNGFNQRRSADIQFIPEPYWTFSSNVATHGSPYSYDAHVPVIFMGAGIRAGRYDMAVAINDIAPTLAAILDVETPAGSVGRVLTEMWETGKP
jgi:predicted AlkP superfamily pyrophosphatase or phosphodiesterase